MTYYSYRKSKGGLLAVGSYDGDDWVPESKHDSVESAMTRTNFLNARASFVNEGGVVEPETTAPYAPTRFDSLLAAAFQGIMANPNCTDLTPHHMALRAIVHTNTLIDQLEERGY